MKKAWPGAFTPEVELVLDPVVVRAQAGDHVAFEELFHRHAPWVHGKLRRMLGAGPEIEDLVQETFVRAFRSLPSFRGQATFEGWLRRICARVAYDHIRSAQSRVRLELVETEACGEGPEHAAQEAVKMLMRIIEVIPPKQRIVLVMHDVEGYTAEEIRLVIGASSVNTVHSRLRLARAELHRRAQSHPVLRDMYASDSR